MKRLTAFAVAGFLALVTLLAATPAYADEGPFVLRNYHTRYCLATDASGAVYTETCSNETWTLVYQDTTNTFQIRHTATGQCVAEGAAGAVSSQPCTMSNNQRWGVRVNPYYRTIMFKGYLTDRYLAADASHRVSTTIGGNIGWLTS
ncbi:MAG: RICIN domain-containing protein [Micromonosporaceae bacterium]